ncbi:hypothetical protein QOZ80_2BG0186260 [Eleusine coracana subsp. coracana]|nr:hypothetical protein QOZ80_2BG0186260 [Eleusine coracana subsp. coracana]
MSPVRVVDVSYVPVPAQAALPPEPIKLNAMEVQWVVLPLFQHILFFEGDQLPPFEAVVHSLKSSLAETLATHGPLAGKLVHLADTGEIAIRCSHDDGVKFVVAESGADARRLAGDEEHNVHAFERLVPELDLSVLPAPLLAVQATRLQGGGVAVGVTVHHGVADGRSLWRFVEAWAAACRGGVPPAAPSFDRSRVKLRLPVGDKELARSVLLKYAPNLPMTNMILREERLRFTRRTFTLNGGHIARLKQHIIRLSEAHDGRTSLLRPPSSFVAVTALTWTCSVRCRSSPSSSPTDDDDDVFLFFFADLRSHLDPPAGADYFGACISGCLPRLPARDLRSDHALAAAAVAIQEAIRDMEADPVGGWDFLTLCTGLSEVNSPYFNVSGSTSFRPYEVADFGWGRPRRTEPVRMNRDGQVALVRARDGDGVQVSVAMLQRAHMEAFKAEFFNAIVNV